MSSITGTLSELKSDLQELEKILTNVIRSNVRRIIANEISTIKSNIESLEQKQKKEQNSQNEEKPVAAKPITYTTKITNYALDESSKFVKLYVSISDISKLTQEQITCDFSESSFKFVASNHLNKNHVLQVLKLAHKVIPSECSTRIKAGKIIISLKKQEEGKTWGTITEADRKTKEAKDAKYNSKDADKPSDPSSGIMDMMKKMYDDGDDDMKRMIKKTWYESQQKQQAGGDAGGMPGMGGTGGMPDMSAMMGGMPGMGGGMPGVGGSGGMPGIGGAGGMPDMAAMMAGMGGMPDMSGVKF